jgi:hypothetical protein
MWIAAIDSGGVPRSAQKIPVGDVSGAPVIAANATGQAVVAFSTVRRVGSMQLAGRVKFTQPLPSGLWSAPRTVPGVSGPVLAAAVGRSGEVTLVLSARVGSLAVIRRTPSGQWGQPVGVAKGAATRAVFAASPSGDQVLAWTLPDSDTATDPVYARVYRAH